MIVGKIYKIYNPEGDANDIYIGVTTLEFLCRRLYQHCVAYKKKAYNLSVYELFDKYGVHNCIIELIKEVEVENRSDLDRIESEYIRNTICVNRRCNPARDINKQPGEEIKSPDIKSDVYTETPMEKCVNQIKENRPKLSDSSIRTYTNILKNIYRDLQPEKEFDHHYFIKEYKHVLAHLEKIKFNVRKTILSALVALTDGVVQNAYRNQMIQDAHQYNALQKQNTMTDIQRENWVSWAEIEEVLEKLKKKTEYIWKEAKPTREEMLHLQKYVILCCYVLLPPRRAMDFCKMKVRNYDKAKDNFYEKGHFYFRQYKTAKFTGLQIEKIPKVVEMLMRKWIPFHNEDLLFSDFMAEEISSSGMTKILNSIFGKNISVNQLRHIYITEKSAPLMKQLEETAEAMGHSTATQKLYVKHLPKDE